MTRDLLISLAASLAVGLLVGLERQRAIVRYEGKGVLLGGVRTFPLLSLCGSVAALVSHAHDSAAAALLPAALLGLVALMAVHRIGLAPDEREDGLTTETAALAVFLLGALAVSTEVIAATVPLLPKSRGAVVTGAFFAALISVPSAALAFVALFEVGGTADVSLAALMSAMVGWHVLIGIGEAIITALTVSAVMAVRPDLVYGARGLLASTALELRTPTSQQGVLHE